MIFKTKKLAQGSPNNLFSNKSILILLTLLITIQSSYSQQEVTVGQKAKRLIKVVENSHLQPVKIDSSSSIKIIETMMKKLDPYAIYFQNDDAIELLKFSDSIRIDIEKYSNKLIDETNSIFSKRIQFIDSLTTALLKGPLDLYKAEHLTIAREKKLEFPTSQNDLIEKWRKLIKSRLLRELQSISNDSTYLQLTWHQLLNQEKDELYRKVEIISKQRLKKITEAPEGFDSYVSNAYLNSIAEINDPHTNYFSPINKQEFEESLSKKYRGFGLSYFDNDNGQIEIDHIIIGSPIWFCKNIEVGDIIKSVKVVDKEEVDLSLFDSSDLTEIIEPNNIAIIELKVSKPNGEIIVQKLIKSKIESESYTRSFVLNGPKKIGYIYIPAFYTSFYRENNTGCALDVMREIIKLQQDSIEGIIIDLRQNGGGSLLEAIDISSIFIEKGEFVSLKSRNMGSQVYAKSNVFLSYTDPLVIMVDQLSASASELLTGVLKINNRGVIVGSTTFGKFSGQVILPLNLEIANTNFQEKENLLGFVKITNHKIYLANGVSYQSIGITPDIEIPTFFNFEQYREANLKNPIKADTIIDRVLTYFPLEMLPLTELKNKSIKRIGDNKYFKAVSMLNKDLREFQEMSKTMPLHIDSFQYEIQKYEKLIARTKHLKDYNIEEFTSINNKLDIPFYIQNENKSLINDRFLQSIQSDPYIEESYFILSDLIDLLKTK
jgi:carboxyl-terminal processing protease